MHSPAYPSKAFRGATSGGVQGSRLLSFAQETMLFWNKLTPDSALYNVPIAFRIHGPLDQHALFESLHLILTRHEVLRSSFFFSGGEPSVIVRECTDPLLEILDLSSISEEERERTLQSAANAECRRPFDLLRGPLLRAALLRLSGDDHVLILTMHHIAADGWSLGVILKELGNCYRAISQHSKPNLPQLRSQYADFARWQREIVQGPESQRTITFWRNQLEGIRLDHDPIPPDYPRQPQQTFDGATLRAVLPASVLGELAQVGQLKRATPFMVMLAALHWLLSSCSGDPHTVIGVPTANRNRAEFEDLVGCFINMVAVRSVFSERMTFLELLSQVRETALAAFLHSEVPFSEVVRHVHPKRSSNRTPIFQVQLVFQSYPMPEMNWPGLVVKRFDVDTGTSKFDLSVLVELKGAELEIGFEYNSRLFERDSMQRMLDDYVALLSCIAKSPHARLRDFSSRPLTLKA